MSKDGKAALLDAIRGGKGFVGMHCATDTFHSPAGSIDPYIEMIGGEFITHGAQQKIKLDVFDEEFPGAKPFGSSFEINDEWYAQKNLADDLHVIIGYDTKTMTGKMYERPNFPQTWARMHGKGRCSTPPWAPAKTCGQPLYQGLVLGRTLVGHRQGRRERHSQREEGYAGVQRNPGVSLLGTHHRACLGDAGGLFTVSPEVRLRRGVAMKSGHQRRTLRYFSRDFPPLTQRARDG